VSASNDIISRRLLHMIFPPIKRSTMTPLRYLEIVACLDWGPQHIADVLGRNERTPRRWASGASPVPDRVAAWLEAVTAAVRAVPVPANSV
jgi:hypothetical protein